MTGENQGRVRDFQDLELWQMAMDLSEQVYRLSWRLPSSEKFGLATQIQPASVSIPSNIAEGRMRGTVREFAHCVAIARGSLAELRTQLILAERLDYVTADQTGQITALAERLAQRLNALRKSLVACLDGETRIANTEYRTPKTGKNAAS